MPAREPTCVGFKSFKTFNGLALFKTLMKITSRQSAERKGRHGAFWEDRYHATTIEADEHLYRCLVYIDLNMVRAGVVNHPGQWKESGFCEIQQPPKRYAVVDLQSVMALTGFVELGDFQTAHLQWVEQALENGRGLREDRWSEAIAVGSWAFC